MCSPQNVGNLLNLLNLAFKTLMGGGGGTCLSMSAYVLSCLDSMRLEMTDMYFGTEADIDRHRRKLADISGHKF